MIDMDADRKIAVRALDRLQECILAEIPDAQFGGTEVRYNPAFGRYHGITFILMPASIENEDIIDTYRDIVDKNLTEEERNHLAVLAGSRRDDPVEDLVRLQSTYEVMFNDAEIPTTLKVVAKSASDAMWKAENWAKNHLTSEGDDPVEIEILELKKTGHIWV